MNCLGSDYRGSIISLFRIEAISPPAGDCCRSFHALIICEPRRPATQSMWSSDPLSSEPCCLTSVTKKLNLALCRGLCGIVYHFKCNANSSVPYNAPSWRLYVGAQCAYTLCTMHDLLLLLQLFYLHCLHGLHCLHCSSSTLHSAAMVGRPMALLAPPCAARALVELRGLAAEKGTRDTEGKTANYSSLVDETADQEYCRPRRADR